jgi:hypothetical protein
MKNRIITSSLICFSLIILSGCAFLAVVMRPDYTQIREGMTYPEIVAIIGEEGEKTTSVRLDDKKPTPGASETTYTWRNPDGSKFVATFIDGKLAKKTLVGLD